ncbi:MAG TPA: hypothetical protein DEB17_00110 [Chlorobaculum sp.]|uniref:Uncharacterized protein n=1 Tax=Chlorobaculum tepidum (strain ATCC 49652 / DSM 12025 / NBRC 103806 / TLS) TaxID=194439 RepID=Q8KC78_CHLTE|nr:hypothetical protein CT1547 [Chlorobaculum tepidum TLS]HBU22402.1 hypothetical protein [Chlorobaculum sp.]
MRWSSASQKASTLPVDFSNEPLDIVLHRGHRKISPIMVPAAHSGSNKTLHYEKSGKVTGKNRRPNRS